ncbi:unnamed protein product [Auanema sp. JU1783]|nr:unnamed protein product [Auanema sp. JU1783]
MNLSVFLLYFGLLLFHLDQNGRSVAAQTERPVVTPQNNNLTYLNCLPAETFIQTHMAPDFLSPQLVRRLDWFHEDALIASYQQNVIDDSSRQWWVADKRFQLEIPFYTLKISPVLPEDAGIYRCRLETDPLFALTMSSAQVQLAVLVPPVPPSSPEIQTSNNHSATLVWNHLTARAHRPIVRYSVAVRSLSNNHRFIIPAPSNATSVIVDNLSPFTLYAFSIRAENNAGMSDFGPETKHRTPGNAPSQPPVFISMTNGSAGCVSMSILPPEEMHGDIKSYTVITSKSDESESRREYFPGSTPIPLNICNLQSNTVYSIAVSVENDFGLSPPLKKLFHSDEIVAPLMPTQMKVYSMLGSPRLVVKWKMDISDVKLVKQFNIYYKINEHIHWKVEHLPVLDSTATSFRHEIGGLDANTAYHVRLSATTVKGEGPKTRHHVVTTDFEVPPPTQLTGLSYDCQGGIKMEWHRMKGRAEYRIEMGNKTRNLIFNTTVNKLDVTELALYSEYDVRIQTTVISSVDNRTRIQGPWSEVHHFILNDQCAYYSSICANNAKCQRLVQAYPSRRFTYLVVIVALAVFVLLCFMVAYILKGCFDMKSLLKKKKEKCVYLDELSPLVYDSTGCEDIPVELFYGYCEDLARNNKSKYRSQFEVIENTTSNDCTSPDALQKNLDKNRYLNIGAMEASRVRLNSATGSDYINANYIDSCDKRNAYIATQAPLPSTFSDFWAMIWQERCNVIVVITNLVEDGRRKCDQYWPSSIDTPQNHGSYQVGLVSETQNAHFIHRIISLKLNKCVPPAERRVHQLHFKGWPDHGVPDSVFPLLDFMHYVSDIHSTGPIVVHCSAGVGRSGSYILIDSMRCHLINFRRLNLMGHLIHMRRQREKLVQTVEQYELCHEAVRQLIRHGITRVHSDLFQRYLHYLSEENINGKTRMQMQYEDLCECKHNPTCVPIGDYVVLPGYHRLDEFIVANWKCETEQLWEMIWSKNCQTVIFLGDQSYWSGIDRVGDMSIEHGDNFVLLQNKEDQLCVRIIPVSKHKLAKDVWDEIERIQKERLAYHDAPLVILNPFITNTDATHTDLNNGNIDYNEKALCNTTFHSPDLSPSLPYTLCALTSLACQLEQQGCVDTVLTISSYAQMHCGIWSSRSDIEFIYSKLQSLVGGSRV